MHKSQNTLKLLYSAYQPNKQLLSFIVWPKPPAQVGTKSKFQFLHMYWMLAKILVKNIT
jgi:hypothetical protein